MTVEQRLLENKQWDKNCPFCNSPRAVPRDQSAMPRSKEDWRPGHFKTRWIVRPVTLSGPDGEVDFSAASCPDCGYTLWFKTPED